MATATLEIPTIEQAQADVERLAAQQTEWTEKRAALVQDLEAQRANAGRAALAGSATGKLADQIARLQTEIGIADQALMALTEQQGHAAHAAKLARAEDCRQRAAALRAEAEARMVKTNELRAALEEWEGCPYGPRPSFDGQMTKTTMMYYQADGLERQAGALDFEAGRVTP